MNDDEAGPQVFDNDYPAQASPLAQTQQDHLFRFPPWPQAAEHVLTFDDVSPQPYFEFSLLGID